MLLNSVLVAVCVFDMFHSVFPPLCLSVIKVNDTLLDLSSPQVVKGVTVSKDPTGVTVVVQIQDLQITVFFDGYTALILVEGTENPISEFDGEDKLCCVHPV